jgi:hypothetical protein
MVGRRRATSSDFLGRVKHDGPIWRHPDDPSIIVSIQCAAAVAVMQMGISDHHLIAEAVGLDVAAIKRIDAAEDIAVRALAVARIPSGEFFKLRVRVLCPVCHGRVYIAPCVLCAQRKVE